MRKTYVSSNKKTDGFDYAVYSNVPVEESPRYHYDFPLKAVYSREDITSFPYVDALPGMPPYIRGPNATMYTVKPWTIRQYAGFSTSQESNAFYRKALAGGMQGISVAFESGYAPRV